MFPCERSFSLPPVLAGLRDQWHRGCHPQVRAAEKRFSSLTPCSCGAARLPVVPLHRQGAQGAVLLASYRPPAVVVGQASRVREDEWKEERRRTEAQWHKTASATCVCSGQLGCLPEEYLPQDSQHQKKRRKRRRRSAQFLLSILPIEKRFWQCQHRHEQVHTAAAAAAAAAAGTLFHADSVSRLSQWHCCLQAEHPQASCPCMPLGARHHCDPCYLHPADPTFRSLHHHHGCCCCCCWRWHARFLMPCC